MILHITTGADYRPGAEYRSPTLDSVGYIHCSDYGTAHLAANRVFQGRTDLLLLVVDPSRVPVRWEAGDPPEPNGTWFPHVYGPIPADAVVAVHDFPPDADGVFRLPAALAG